MGSCVSSVHKRTSDSAMKMDLSFDSKNGKLLIPPSPIKEKPANGEPPINGWSSSSFRDLGSKEETFYDSRAWLESDCEDDFFSVNGDFTPSRGSTPVHHNFAGTPRVNRTPGSTPGRPPTGKKMKLAELFRQSTKEDSEDQHYDEHTQGSQNAANGKTEVKTTILDVLPSTDDTPYISGANSLCSSERTTSGDSIMEKPMKSVQCCLPSLVSCHVFSERKKKMSPAIAVNG